MDWQGESKRYGHAKAGKKGAIDPLGLKFFESKRYLAYSIWNASSGRLSTRLEWEIIDRGTKPEELKEYLEHLIDLIPENYRRHPDVWKSFDPGDTFPHKKNNSCDTQASYPNIESWLEEMVEEKWQSSLYLQVTFPINFSVEGIPELESGTPRKWKRYHQKFRRKARNGDFYERLELEDKSIRAEVIYRIDLFPPKGNTDSGFWDRIKEKIKGSKNEDDPRVSFFGHLGPCLHREADFLDQRWREVADPEHRL